MTPPYLRPRAALILILLAGLLLRLWGVRFGLPLTTANPDERAVAGIAVKFLRGTFNPEFFHYPTLYMYVLGALYAAYCATRIAGGAVTSLAACADTWPREWPPFFIIDRLLSVAAGVASIALIYALGRRLGTTERERTASGLAAATLLAVAFLHVRDSHFGVTDVAMTAMVLGSLLLLCRADEQPAPWRFQLAGLVGGLAASTKYNAALLAAPALVSQAAAWREARASGSPFDVRLLHFAGAAAIGFLVGTPYALLDFPGFREGVLWDMSHLRQGHGIYLGPGLRRHFVFTLWHGVGWPLLIVGIAGAAWLFVRRPRAAALLFAFPIAYYVVAGRGNTVFARYMIPVVPFVCLGAAALATRLSRGRTIAAAALVVVCAAPNVVKSIQLDRLLTRTDSRVAAAEWIGAHMTSGSSVFEGSGTYSRPDLWRRGAPPPYPIWTWNDAQNRFETPGGPTDRWPEWIVTQESPLRLYGGEPPPRVQDGLRQYQLAWSIRATTASADAYDQQDAWFLPLTDLGRVSVPGPNLFVYRLSSRPNP